MESEDFEQIPWASLVAEQEDGIDRRIYLAVGVVAVLVIVVFGMRLLGDGSQPPAAEFPITATSTSSLADKVPDIDPPTSMIIAEADLRVEEPTPVRTSNTLVSVTAEWFVTGRSARSQRPMALRSPSCTGPSEGQKRASSANPSGPCCCHSSIRTTRSW
jgi:hypothetical protein